MIRVLALALIALLSTFSLTRPAAAQDWQLVDANTITPGSYLVLTVPLDTPEALGALANRLAEDFDVPLAAEWPLNAISVHCLVFDARQSGDVAALIAAMDADARIRTVQRIQGFALSEEGGAAPRPTLPQQWALDRMNVPGAHQVSLGAGVQVGIIDSAIDRSHPDLAPRVADARDFVNVRTTGEGESHGTAVAGLIGAGSDDGGLVGVAPEAQLIGLRACWQVPDAPSSSGICNSFSLARAINFAILNEIKVLNLSIGGPHDPLLEELLDTAEASGMVLIAASGDSGEVVFPASHPGVISAGAIGANSVPAPMTDVLSTAPGASYRYV